MNRWYVTVLAILLMALIGGSAYWLLADSSTGQTPVSAQGAQPNYLAPVYKYETKPGIYVWGGPYRGLLPEGNEDLGGTIFPIRGHIASFHWDELVHVDKSTGQYKWYFGSIDAWLREQCDRQPIKVKNRYAAFYIVPYTSSPTAGTKHLRIPKYMIDPTYPHSNPSEAYIPYDFGGSSPGDGIPKYWSNYFQTEMAKLVAQLGRKYRDRGDCIAFIGIGTGRDGETAPADTWNRSDLKALLASNGLTSDEWVAYVDKVVDMYVKAFSSPNCDGPNHLCIPLLLQAAPYYSAPSERKRFTDYAASKGVGDSINGLYPEQTGAYVGDGTGMYEPLYRHPNLPGAFETYFQNFACSTTQWIDRYFYWGMINGISKHIDFLRPKWDLVLKPQYGYDYPCPWGFCQYPPERIQQDFVPIFKWMEKYLGVTTDTTPDVWVALKEHRNPFNVCNNSHTAQGGFEQGNYSFWLYQEDIPTGITVPETNAQTDQHGVPIVSMGLNRNPYNPNLPDTKEAWYIRRTDEGTGNPNMFFNVDDAYLYGGTATVTVTVTYIDMYTDTFSLHYPTLTDPDVKAKVVGVYEVPNIYADPSQRTPVSVPLGGTDVQKQGTKTLRQAIFLLENANLKNQLPQNRGGEDFYLSSNNDGDEWVHMVALTYDKATFAPEPTPTPTPTPTATPTATPTPSPTPTTARVYGMVWDDANRNFAHDANEQPIAGVTVKLLDQTTRAEKYSDITDADGHYDFPAISPGAYILKVVVPDGYAPVLLDEFPLGNLVAGQVLPLNIGLYQLPTPTPTITPTPTATPTPTPARVAGVVFDDQNRNGQQDSGEPGLGDVQIDLVSMSTGGLQGRATVVATTSTAADGSFVFDGVEDGTYQIVQAHLWDYIPTTGYAQTVTVVRGNEYTLSFPNRSVAIRIWVPLVRK